MFLRGDNIYLRALEPEDAELLYQWENDPDFWKVSNTLVPFSLQNVKDYISGIQDIYTTKQLRLMICLNVGAVPIGTLDLFDFDPYHKRAGLGILIAERNERKKNLASEALGVITNYAFGLLQLHQLYCNVSEDNVASLALFKKAGYVHCGTKKSWLRHGFTWVDEYMMQLINDDDKA